MTPIFKKMALALSAFALVATTGMAYAAGGKSDYKMKHQFIAGVMNTLPLQTRL